MASQYEKDGVHDIAHDIAAEASDNASSSIEDHDLGQFGYKPELKVCFDPEK